jgi:hypothetical protein
MDAPVGVADVLACHGGKVEAVLLLADDQGRLRDEFAWCLALDVDVPGAVAGRVCIPASRQRAGAAATSMVGNLAAVAAWGDWHEPDTELTLPEHISPAQADRLRTDPTFRRLEPRGGTAAVRVLDITRTARHGTRTAVPTGRPVAPHMRRGHWRRQRFGPGGLQVRRVRIAPTLVNASRYADAAPQVYRLPLHAGAAIEAKSLNGPGPAATQQAAPGGVTPATG